LAGGFGAGWFARLPADLSALTGRLGVESTLSTAEDGRGRPLNFSWLRLWHWPRDLRRFTLLCWSRLRLRCGRSLLPPCRWRRSCRRCCWLICLRHRLLRRSVPTIGIDSRVSDIYVPPDDIVACARTGRLLRFAASQVVVIHIAMNAAVAVEIVVVHAPLNDVPVDLNVPVIVVDVDVGDW
jgi:hypothetical protein